MHSIHTMLKRTYMANMTHQRFSHVCIHSRVTKDFHVCWIAHECSLTANKKFNHVKKTLYIAEQFFLQKGN